MIDYLWEVLVGVIEDFLSEVTELEVSGIIGSVETKERLIMYFIFGEIFFYKWREIKVYLGEGILFENLL